MKKAMKKVGLADIETFDDHQEWEEFKEKNEVTPQEAQEMEYRRPKVLVEREQNQIEEKMSFGKKLIYGEPIQLKHIKSGRFLSLTKDTARQPGTWKAEVLDDGDEGSAFNIMPGFKVRTQGDEVRITDQVTLQNWKRSTPERPNTLHVNAIDMGKCNGLEKDQSEIHGWDEPSEQQKERQRADPNVRVDKPSKFEIRRYAKYDVGEYGGQSRICSGQFVRMLHRQDEAFLRYGDVPRPKLDDKGGSVHFRAGHKLHLHSTLNDRTPDKVTTTSSNGVWEVTQTDQESLDLLTEKMRRASKNPDVARVYPREDGGNIKWNRLFRFKHVGTQKYLAASFSGGAERGGIRFYLCDLTRTKEDGSIEQLPGAHLESLWKIWPINPLTKSEAKREIELGEVFYLQHAVSSHYVRAGSEQSAEHGMKPSYYTDGSGLQSVARMTQLHPDRSYSDAFGFHKVRDDPEPEEDWEVRDINKIMAVIPVLEDYIAFMKSVKPLTTKKTSTMEAVLSDLIVVWITKDSTDKDWRTRDAAVHRGRRQQLLREQGVLDLLVQITEAKPYIELGIDYNMMHRPELLGEEHVTEYGTSMPNVKKLCWMSNRLMKYAVQDNAANSQYMIPHIMKYKAQIGAGEIGDSAMEILRVLHVDQPAVLNDLDASLFTEWVELVHTNLKQRKIVGNLSVPIRFLADTCLCNNEPVRQNQVWIKDALFADTSPSLSLDVADGAEPVVKKPSDESWVYSNAVLKFAREGSVVYVQDISGTTVKKRYLEEVFTDDSPEAREMQDYIVASITLYANLCAKNEDCQEHVKRILPEATVQNIIINDSKNTEPVRAACCDLLFRVYIDAEGRQEVPPINSTRIFEDIIPANAHKLMLRDDIPFPDLKRWIVTFLSERASMHACKANVKDNMFVVAVCKLILNLLKFGVYTDLAELEDVLRPLLGILDVHTDTVDAEEASFQGETVNGETLPLPNWREKLLGSNVSLVYAKTEVCRILARVQDMALDLRITKMLLAFSNHLQECRQKNQEEGTFSSEQLCQYIRGGSKLNGCKDWSSVEKKMKGVGGIKDMFSKLDLNSKELRDPKFVTSRSFINDLYEVSLIPYRPLQDAVYKVMTQQFCQRANLANKLTQVQLLCGTDDVEFYQRANSFLSALKSFLNSPREPEHERQCAENVMKACLEIEDAKTVEQKQSRQRLFNNVQFPEQVLNILKSSKLEKEHRSVDGYSTERVGLMMKCYMFLLASCKGNTEIKNQRVFSDNMSTFVDHLDVKPFPAGANHKVELHAEALVLELYDNNYALVQSVTSETVKRFVNLIVNNGRLPTWLKFLNKLAVVGEGKDGQPVKKNQQLIIKGLIQNKAKTLTPSLYRTEEEWKECVALMEGRDETKKVPTPGGLAYHIELIDLMFRCAIGENKAAEQLCQNEVPLEAIHRGLCDPLTVPVVKKAYLNFLWESYVRLERPKRATPTEPRIWAILDKLADDLLNSQLTMVAVGSVEGNFRTSEDYVQAEIQYLYREGLEFITNWYMSYFHPGGNPDAEPPIASWEGNPAITIEQQENMRRISKKIFDGVCVLLERPADPCCQIGIKDTEAGYMCAMWMARVEVHPSNQYDAVSKSFIMKGEKAETAIDQFGKDGGVPPNTKLIQLGFDVLAADFKNAIDPEVELQQLAVSMRNLIMADGGDPKLLFGDRKEVYSLSSGIRTSASYVRSAVAHVQKSRDEEVRRILLVALKLVMEPHLGFVKNEDARLQLVTTLQRLMSADVADGGLDVPSMIFDLLRELAPTERRLAEMVLNLFRRQVARGDRVVQEDVFRKLIADTRRCERVFYQLESRLAQGQVEAKSGQTRHQTQALRAAEAAAAKAAAPPQANKDIVAIEDAQEYTKPKEESLEFGYVTQIFQIMKDLCEDDNQKMKRFLALQPTDTNYNLFSQVVDFVVVWQRSMDAHNVEQGKYAFKALTELVIGPCRENQETLIRDLKMDSINELFALHPYKDAEGNTLEKSPFEAFRDAGGCPVELCKVMCSCVRLLQAMLEGANEATRARLIKTLEELELEKIEINVNMIYQEYQQSKLFSEQLKLKVLGLPPFDKTKLDLGFLLVTLHRQIHDCKEDRKKPVEFKSFYMEQPHYQVNLNQTREKVRIAQEKYDAAERALDYFYGRMARIEILRETKRSTEGGGEGLTETRLERVYFQIPTICYLLPQTTKDALRDSVDRSSQEEKLKWFIMKADEYQKEMMQQEILNGIMIYSFLSRFKDRAWTMIFYMGGYGLNLLMIISIDHEDKFDADPLANFEPDIDEGELGTPYNLLDIQLEGGVRTIAFPNWATMKVDHAQRYEKVAYMPIQSYYILRYLGVVLLALSCLTMGLFILGNAVLIVYTGFKREHNESEAEKKRKDANYDVVKWRLNMWEEQKGSNVFSWALFVLKATYFVLTHTGFLIQACIAASCWLGFFWSPFAYALLWFMILGDPDLMSAMDAVIKPLKEILKVLMLAAIIMYVFTVVSFTFFHDHFNEGDQKEDNMCNGMLQCFVFTFINGVITSEMWFAKAPADLWPTKRYDVQHDEETQNAYVFMFRIMWDVFFFLFVGVTLIGGVLFGIILDKYAELRQIAEETTSDQRNSCFICLIPRENFDKDGASGGFPMHVEDDHHLWYYIYFYVYLDLGGMSRDRTELNGPENYVKGKLMDDPFDVDWFPREEAMVLEKASPVDMVAKTLSDVEQMTGQIDLMKQDSADLRKNVMELLTTVKIVASGLEGQQ